MLAKLPTLRIASPQATADIPMLQDSEQEPQGPSLQQLFSIVWAHRKISALLIIVLSILFAVVIKFMPKSYDATTTIMVNFDSGDALGGTAFPVGFMDSYIVTQIEIMRSTPVMNAVVEDLDISTLGEFSAGYSGQGTLADWVRVQLLKNLTITHPNFTQLIYVNATSRSPTDAARIANAVAKVYLAQQDDRLRKPALEQSEKYAKQLEDLKAKVNLAQANVTEYRQRNQLTSMVAGNEDAEVTALVEMETRYQNALDAERALALNSSGQRVTLAAAQSPVVVALRGQLVGLETNMANLKTSLGSNHPRVIELRAQIESIKAQINSEIDALSGTLTVQLAAARENVSLTRAALEAQRKRALTLRNDQDEGGKLLLELESAQSLYKRVLDGYDKIMLGANGASNVRLMTNAEPPLKSTKPNKMKLLIMAFFAAFGIGLAVPFAYDFLLHRRIRCKDDIERGLSIPVLAEFRVLSHAGVKS